MFNPINIIIILHNNLCRFNKIINVTNSKMNYNLTIVIPKICTHTHTHKKKEEEEFYHISSKIHNSQNYVMFNFQDN